MTGYRLRGLLLALPAVIALSFTTAGAAGEKYAVFGGDTTPAERQELAQIFGLDANAVNVANSPLQTVTTPEMVAALQNTGLPVAATDKSISSSVLTCGNKGDGLDVRTQNIVRISAPVYANALITAGVGDGQVLIAAPQSNPVTGETALVGVLKSFPQCQAGAAPDTNRVRTAYQQIAWTSTLAGPSGDLNRAAAVMLQAQSAVLTGKAPDDASAGQALDQAAASQGIQVPAASRPQIIQFVRSLAALDYGAYAKGYQVQQVSPNEVRVTPSGGPAAAPAASAAPAVAATVANPAATATSAAPVAAASSVAATVASSVPVAAPVQRVTGVAYTGDVTRTGTPLTVHSGNQDRSFAVAPGLVVTRNGKPAQVADIKKGDRVTVATNPDDSANRIDATSAAGSNNAWLWWLIPLLLLLALAALLWLFLQRRRGNFVLEPNSAEAGGQTLR